MNRLGCAIAGVTVGLLLMQLGHWLYLRNDDYAVAIGLTMVFGALFTGLGNAIGEDWE